MKKFTLLLSAILMIIGIVNISAQKKRVLLEEQTGAWCGWCTDGAYIVDETVKQYPDDVIAVALHNGDAMALPEQQTLAQSLGGGSYPSAMVDRTLWGFQDQNGKVTNQIFVNRGYWKQLSEVKMQESPKVDVELLWNYNSSTNRITAVISSEILESIDKEIRFNVYICEDNVTGSGQGYDQVNYLSGRSGYEHTPYYNQPSVISGYKHMKVVRKMLGGAWGTANSISLNPKVGSTIKYTYNVTLDPSWNLDDIFLVGFVQEYDPTYVDLKKILNCVYGKEGNPYSEISSSGPEIAVKSTGDAFSKIFTLKNVSNSQVTFRINDEKSMRTPSDWTSSVTVSGSNISGKSDETQASEIKINPDQTVEVVAELIPGATPGIGDLSIEILNKSDLGGQKSKAMITAVSNEIEVFQVMDFNDNKYSVISQMTASGINNAIDISPGEYEEVGSMMTNLSTLVWNCGEKGEISSSEASAITTAINDGISVIMMGANMPHNLKKNAPSLMSYLGLDYLKPCRQGYSSLDVYLTGYPDDPISNGFDQSAKLITTLTPALEITGQNTFPILKHKFVDTVVAVRAIVNDTRVVLLGINPFIITNTYQRDELLANCFDWLASVGPSIACADELSFGETETGMSSEQTLVITNEGKSELIVTDLEIDYNYQTVFKVVVDKNIIIPAQSSFDLTIQFTPAYAINYNSWIKIYSNADNEKETTITLTGKGKAATAGPVLSLSSSELNFIDAGVGSESNMSFNVNNNGNEDLNVTNITVPGAFASVFIIEPTSFTVAPESQQEVNVTFKPVEEGVFETNATIISNNKEGSKQIALKANAVVGVEDFVSENEFMSVSAGPNPFQSNTVINFTLNGDRSREIKIVAIDASGRTIKEFDNKILDPGTYNYEFNSLNLASATYYIIAKTGDSSVGIPVVLTK